MAVELALSAVNGGVAELSRVSPSRSKRKRAAEDVSSPRRTTRSRAEPAIAQQPVGDDDDERSAVQLYSAPPPRRAAIAARRATRRTLVPQSVQQQRAGRGNGRTKARGKGSRSAKASTAQPLARRSASASTSYPASSGSRPSRATAPSTQHTTSTAVSSSSSSSSTTARRAAKRVEFAESTIVGVGLNGLGYGCHLSRAQLSLEWLRQHHSVRELPVSRADKERLVNGSGEQSLRGGIAYTHSQWCSIGDGWYVGEWVKKCRLPRQQRAKAHTPHSTQAQAQTAASSDGADGSSQQSDGAAHDGVDRSSEQASTDVEDGEEAGMDNVLDGAGETEEEQRSIDAGEEDERDGAETAVTEGEVGGAAEVDEAHMSPLRLQRKRGRATSWQRHECSNSCWEMRGYGYQVNSRGVQYVGHFAGGALNDPAGVIVDVSGVYCGGVVQGADEGNGCFYYRANGDVATGVWRQGSMHVGSVLYGDHNALYTGAFHSNKQDGLGLYDVLTPATGSAIRQHVGQWKAGTWKGAGKAVFANRTVTGSWLGEGTERGSLGLVECLDEEGMKLTYVGEMSTDAEGCGQGKLRWEERSAGEKRQQEHDDGQRAEAAAKRKKQHMQRRSGDWSSLADVEKQQQSVTEHLASLSNTLASLPTIELPFNSPSSSLYIGAVQGSRANGHGVRRWANGDIFSGHWVDGVCNGFGSWLSQDRNDSLGSILYSGHWKHDKEHGRGTLLSSLPSLGRMLFHGRFVDGWLTGMGSVYFADSGRLYYVGRMVGGAFDGEGVMRLEDGSLYVGGFVDGTFRGDGRWVDTRECSVFTGRFKHDYKHGCGRLTIHQRLEEHSRPAASAVEQQQQVAVKASDGVDVADDRLTVASDSGEQPVDGRAAATIESTSSAEVSAVSQSAAARFDEQSDSEIVRSLSATKSVTPEEALAACHHAITLPLSFGPATRSYLAVYNRDRPAIRIVGDELDELLAEIAYDVDDGQADKDGLVREEQLDTAKDEKRKARQRKPGKSKVAAVGLPAIAAQTDAAREQDTEAEKEQDIGEADAAIEGNGMLMLRHYQDELDRIHTKKAAKRRTKKEKLMANSTASASSSASAASAITSTGTPFLRQSLSQPPAPLALFESPAAGSNIRRIHLGRAIAACSSHGVCSAAVTGQLPADYAVHYCATCSKGGPGDDEEDEKRVEVCGACRVAGCHRGHETRAVHVVDKGKEGDPTNGEAALFYCHCSVQPDKCRTKMKHYMAAIERAALWPQHEQPEEPMEADTAAGSRPSAFQHDTGAAEQHKQRQQHSPTEGDEEMVAAVPPASGDLPLDSVYSPISLKPSELRARSAQFVQRVAPSAAEAPLSFSSTSAAASLAQPQPQPPSFRSLLSLLSSSATPQSALCAALPPSLPAPVRKAGPRWVKVDGKWMEESSSRVPTG